MAPSAHEALRIGLPDWLPTRLFCNAVSPSPLLLSARIGDRADQTSSAFHSIDKHNRYTPELNVHLLNERSFLAFGLWAHGHHVFPSRAEEARLWLARLVVRHFACRVYVGTFESAKARMINLATEFGSDTGAARQW